MQKTKPRMPRAAVGPALLVSLLTSGGLISVAAPAAYAQAAPAAPPVVHPEPPAVQANPPVPIVPSPMTLLSADNPADFSIGPVYAPAPEMMIKDTVPHGTVQQFVMESTDSKIYPGISKTQPGTVPYHRRVAVYIPAGYVPGTPSPVIVAMDGGGYRGTLPRALDNLIAEHRVPSMIAVMIDSGGGDSIGSQRGLEYDTVSGLYATFVETEVLPKIEKDMNVVFTKDPNGRATIGGSSGGSAAFTMAWFRPDLYRRVITYSGTYVNQQSPLNPDSPHGAWEYHEHLIAATPAKPIRLWLEVGQNDNGSTRDEASYHNWVMANQRMAAALKAKGYQYRYVYAVGAGHVDGRVVRETLPSALEWVWQGYKAK